MSAVKKKKIVERGPNKSKKKKEERKWLTARETSDYVTVI